MFAVSSRWNGCQASECIQMAIYWLQAHKDSSHIAMCATNGFIQQTVPTTLLTEPA